MINDSAQEEGPPSGGPSVSMVWIGRRDSRPPPPLSAHLADRQQRETRLGWPHGSDAEFVELNLLEHLSK